MSARFFSGAGRRSIIPRTKQSRIALRTVLLILPIILLHACGSATGGRHIRSGAPADISGHGPELIRLSDDGARFVRAGTGAPFYVWGFNYDHDRTGRLIEDCWVEEWPVVEEDFREMKILGANVVRIHLQLAKFMKAPDRPDRTALDQLARLVMLAEETGLYLDITGLGCYHKRDVLAWYDALDEAGRWDVQARFWEAVAGTCVGSDAVFCYDLMNEPILPGAGEKETEWLTGEFGGKYFVQRIALDLAGRTRERVAGAWVDKLAASIRKHDDRHMITVGVIPWAYTFPGATPLFYSEEAGKNLDFVSVHVYPEKGQIDRMLAALEVYCIGKPLLIEETSPLWCGADDFDSFIDASRKDVSGYMGFYWGETIEEYSRPDADIGDSIMREWLEYFRRKVGEMVGGQRQTTGMITKRKEDVS